MSTHEQSPWRIACESGVVRAVAIANRISMNQETHGTDPVCYS